MRERLRAMKSAPLVLAMLLVALAAVVGQRVIANRAFNDLEASTVAGDAHRVAVALSYETKLLRGFGATNAIWDDSYDAVATGSEADFASAFLPADIKAIGDADAAVGIDSKGGVRVGGLADGESYTDLPAGLGSDQLASMVAFDADAGTGQCGLVTAGDVPYLYCGFPARRSDSGGQHGFGLVFLRALDAAAMARLSETTGITLRLTSAGTSTPAAPEGEAQELSTDLGVLTATTRVTGSDALDLRMALPAMDGAQVVLSSPHHRPIHATDSRTANETFLLMGGSLVVLLLLVRLLVRRSLHHQVEPLRSTTEAIIASGDPDLRVDASGRGELAALGGTINTLLDSIAGHEAEVVQAQKEHEQSIIENHRLQESAEEAARAEAQERVDATIDAVVAELTGVLSQANRVLDAARDIDHRSTDTDAITADVLNGTAAANEALAELNATLQQVFGIVGIIRQITEQTRMLALNANIEAARVGDVGAGFRVVAHEVRSLAADTASSADEIAATTGLVTSTADRVVRTLEDVTARAVAVGAATSDVRAVASDQTVTVEQLTSAVRLAVDRIQAMGGSSPDLGHRRSA